MVAGFFQLPGNAGPTVWNSLSDFVRDPTISADCFRRLLKMYICLLDTSALSALEVLWRLLRHIYLLTYLLGYSTWTDCGHQTELKRKQAMNIHHHPRCSSSHGSRTFLHVSRKKQIPCQGSKNTYWHGL